MTRFLFAGFLALAACSTINDDASGLRHERNVVAAVLPAGCAVDTVAVLPGDRNPSDTRTIADGPFLIRLSSPSCARRVRRRVRTKNAVR
jgi:hypothetical protein